MAAADNLLNWGYTPIGTPLGSEGALSMPTDEVSGLGNPMDDTAAAFSRFLGTVQSRYNSVTDVSGSVWDPRGDGALSRMPADYKTTDLLRPDEVAVQLNQSDDQLGGGDPVLSPYLPDTSAAAGALEALDIGFSKTGAASLADSLVAYDQKILDSIYLPPPVEPKVTNAMGFTTATGGLPEAFTDSRGAMSEATAQTVQNVIAAAAEYQHVDDNGVVHKYDAGNDPYTAMSLGRLGAMALPTGARKPTPAQIRSNPALAMAVLTGSSNSNGGNGMSSLSSAAGNYSRATRQTGASNATGIGSASDGIDAATGASNSLGASSDGSAGTSSGSSTGTSLGVESGTTGSGSAYYSEQSGNNYIPSGEDYYAAEAATAPTGMSTAKKVGIAALAAAGLGGLLFFASRRRRGGKKGRK